MPSFGAQPHLAKEYILQSSLIGEHSYGFIQGRSPASNDAQLWSPTNSTDLSWNIACDPIQLENPEFRQWLHLRVELNRQPCFIGEPFEWSHLNVEPRTTPPTQHEQNPHTTTDYYSKCHPLQTLPANPFRTMSLAERKRSFAAEGEL